MKILNLGSLNIDHVYAVDHLVQPGETLAATNYELFAGGKGLNQSIALARAGAKVFHLGKVGRDGSWLLERLKDEGVDISFVETVHQATGHAMIQVDRQGENAIVIYGGANREITEQSIAHAISLCRPGDWLLTQNETSAVTQAIRAAKAAGMHVAFNPAPMSDDVIKYPLEDVDLLLLNETEAEKLTGEHGPEKVRQVLADRFPEATCVLTLGAQGAFYFNRQISHFEPAIKVHAVDTTAAGDTFIGYFLTEFLTSANPQKALQSGCLAASICVTRPGTADSIPRQRELFLQ